jgi:hypothetical protein
MKKPLLLSLAVLAISLACLCDLPFTILEEVTSQLSSTEEAASPYTDPIECDGGNCIDSCLVRVNSLLRPEASYLYENQSDLYESYDLASYVVAEGELGRVNTYNVPDDLVEIQEDYATQERIWDYASSLLPAEDLNMINQYLIYTDGADNELAYVYYDDKQGRTKWMLAVDVVDANQPVQLTHTLVHEYGHLLTLNADQIPEDSDYWGWDQEASGCDTFTYYYGCTNEDSYINLFYEAFWVDIFPDWKEIVGDPSEDLEDYDVDAVERFYEMYSDQFIDDYAPTEIGEDIAESFEYFVLKPMPDGDSIPEQKILFFYQFPELVELREQMIQAMCSFEG